MSRAGTFFPFFLNDKPAREPPCRPAQNIYERAATFSIRDMENEGSPPQFIGARSVRSPPRGQRSEWKKEGGYADQERDSTPIPILDRKQTIFAVCFRSMIGMRKKVLKNHVGYAIIKSDVKLFSHFLDGGNDMKVPKRIASGIINALKGGVVPRVGLGYIAVGRSNEINALLHDVSIAEDGGSFFRFVVGKYGSGKSFLIQTMRQHVMDRGFAAADADLSPERRLAGSNGQGLATYRELARSLSIKASPDGGALPIVLEKWIDSVRYGLVNEGMSFENPFFNAAVEKKIYERINSLKNMVHGFDFAKVIIAYYHGVRDGNDVQKTNAVRWLRGEYSTKTEARNDLGVSVIISDADWYDYIKLLASFLVSAGYKGLVIMIDELVNIMKISNSVTRQNNYEKMLMMYNDVMQGKASNLGIIMGGTPQCIEDTRRGVFSYEALRSRLERGRFATDEVHDMLAPIIRLDPLTYEELTVLTEKLAEIHAGLYDYEVRITLEDRIFFVKAEFERVGASTNVTPREMIRDFIELLNMAYQNPDKTIPQLMGEEEFKMSEGDGSGGEEDGFADFDI